MAAAKTGDVDGKAAGEQGAANNGVGYTNKYQT